MDGLIQGYVVGVEEWKDMSSEEGQCRPVATDWVYESNE